MLLRGVRVSGDDEEEYDVMVLSTIVLGTGVGVGVPNSIRVGGTSMEDDVEYEEDME
jgi:hypothetical protein